MHGLAGTSNTTASGGRSLTFFFFHEPSGRAEGWADAWCREEKRRTSFDLKLILFSISRDREKSNFNHRTLTSVWF
jgi:hypothetical protein